MTIIKYLNDSFGFYVENVSFGLYINSPELYQQIMDNILDELHSLARKAKNSAGKRNIRRAIRIIIRIKKLINRLIKKTNK